MNLKLKQKQFMLGRFLLISAVMLLNTSLFAQNTVSGVVTDASTNESLIGATVVVKGTSLGTVTHPDGSYLLNVSSLQDTLVFSYIGYKTKEIFIGGKTTVSVSLDVSTELLNEMVVIGYGTVKKSDLTGSVAVVSAEELNRVPSSNFSNALLREGRASGVIVSQSGTPGYSTNPSAKLAPSTKVPIRFMSLTESSPAGSLGVSADGYRNHPGSERCLGLGIYGADGANGVIIITERVKKESQYRYRAFLTANRVPKQFDVMDANEYADFLLDSTDRKQDFCTGIITDGPSVVLWSGWERGRSGGTKSTARPWDKTITCVSGGGESSRHIRYR
ncbi:MAG: carboxypeptidase-like regulatory domain-containing protein [Draconibacterium sp.]